MLVGDLGFNRGAMSQIGHAWKGFPGGVSLNSHFHEHHTGRWQELVFHGQVGGGKTEFLAQLTTTHHPALHRVGSTEQEVRLGQVAFADDVPNPRTLHCAALDHDGGDAVDPEPLALTDFPQQRDGSSSIPAELPIRPDGNPFEPGALAEEVVDKFSGGLHSELPGEGEIEDEIDPLCGKEWKPLTRSGEGYRGVLGSQDLQWMGVEGDDPRSPPGAESGLMHGVLDHPFMAEVDSVEGPDSEIEWAVDSSQLFRMGQVFHGGDQ